MTTLDGATVLVTGACGGFGREMMRQFLAAGSRLIVTDRDAAALAEVAGGIPSETGGRETATVRAVVPDMAARHAHAAEAGAEIVMPLEAQDHGGSSFSLRDPGGHVWMLGGYDPAATA